MTAIKELLRADPVARRRLLKAASLRDLAEIVLPRPVAPDLVDEILGSPSLSAVRSVRGLSFEALVHLCHRKPPLLLARAQVVLRWNDSFYLFRESLPSPAKGLPHLAHLEFDDSATLNPDAFPGSVNGLLHHPLVKSLETFTVRRGKAWVRYAAVHGGWAAEVEAATDYVDPFVRLFSSLTVHVRAVTFRAPQALKPRLAKQLREWEAAVAGTLTVTIGRAKPAAKKPAAKKPAAKKPAAKPRRRSS